METLKLLIRATMLMLAIVLIGGCGQGWSVGGIQLTPQDTVTNTVFIEVMGADSVIHYYHGTVYSQSNWCWIHHQFEDVVK